VKKEGHSCKKIVLSEFGLFDILREYISWSITVFATVSVTNICTNLKAAGHGTFFSIRGKYNIFLRTHQKGVSLSGFLLFLNMKFILYVIG
jgi:hypothetical protein